MEKCSQRRVARQESGEIETLTSMDYRNSEEKGCHKKIENADEHVDSTDEKCQTHRDSNRILLLFRDKRVTPALSNDYQVEENSDASCFMKVQQQSRRDAAKFALTIERAKVTVCIFEGGKGVIACLFLICPQMIKLYHV